MATVTKGRTFVSGETVTPTKLNELVDNATVTSIVDADVSASAAIALSKLATGALPTAITVASANLVDGTIVNADINATAAIAGSKLADAGITAAKINGVAKDGSGVDVAVGTAPIFGCRAWVNFDGTSVTNVGGEDRCTIRAAGNVSKVVRNGTGDYTVHFATAMADTNYSFSSHAFVAANYGVASGFDGASQTAASFRILCRSLSNVSQNPEFVCVSIFR
jgi:hypothetical protein